MLYHPTLYPLRSSSNEKGSEIASQYMSIGVASLSVCNLTPLVGWHQVALSTAFFPNLAAINVQMTMIIMTEA
jgi:hypothetical protein